MQCKCIYRYIYTFLKIAVLFLWVNGSRGSKLNGNPLLTLLSKEVSIVKLLIHVTGTLMHLFHVCAINASPSLHHHVNLGYEISFLPGSTEQLSAHLLVNTCGGPPEGPGTVLGWEALWGPYRLRGGGRGSLGVKQVTRKLGSIRHASRWAVWDKLQNKLQKQAVL